MVRYLAASLAGGILFGALDALINANPLARRLFAVYQPIARERVDAGAGIAIDLCYGFALAGIFLLLRPALPGRIGAVKGLSYAAIVWFFRVAMQTASQWMVFAVPGETVLYSLAAGLLETAVLGLVYGLILGA